MCKRFGTFILVVFVIFALGLAGCGGGGGGGSESNAGATTYDSNQVADWAIADMGGDPEAGASILMALADGTDLPDIVAAIEAGTLTETGTIASAAALSALDASEAAGLADICDYPEDRSHCYSSVETRLIDLHNSGKLNENVTGVILRAANRGYSADQIMNALMSMLVGDFRIYINEATGDILIAEDPFDLDSHEKVEPENDPVDIFSDQEMDDDGDTGNDGDDDIVDADPFPWTYKGESHNYDTMVHGDASGTRTYTRTWEVTLFADGTVEGTVQTPVFQNFYASCGPSVKYMEDGPYNHNLSGTHANGEIAFGFEWADPTIEGVYDSHQITLLDKESVQEKPAPSNCTEENPGYPYSIDNYTQFDPLVRTNPPR